MTKLKRKHKHESERHERPEKPLPLPGEAGLEIISLLMENRTDEAYDLLYETYIGTPGQWAEIIILEDDGETLFYTADRGPFKVYGLGRELILEMKEGTELALRGELPDFDDDDELDAEPGEADKPTEPPH
jgi:hypothetical protein